ncbi:MAG: hypothetical protein ACTIM4_13650 [Marinomonas sp.]
MRIRTIKMLGPPEKSMNIDSETKADIDFISSLDNAGFLGWPIDYEVSKLNKFDTSSWFESAIEEYEKHTFLEFGKDGTGSGFCLWVILANKENHQ